MPKKISFVVVLITLLLIAPGVAFAQAYSFQIPQETVHIFYNDDGSASIDYVIVFANDPGAHPIDYVDLGLPNPSFADSSITADVNGNPVSDISRSGFQGSGPGVDTGVAIGLGKYTIPPGQTGTVHVYIDTIERMLRGDDEDPNYASAVFAPAWFQTVRGTTNASVTFHLPPGVEPEEPRWHSAPSGWPSEPETGIDGDGNITYTWANVNASMDRMNKFGASFPRDYVPEEAVFKTTTLERVGLASEDVVGGLVCGGFIIFFVAVAAFAIRAGQRRQLQYMPPKISIEGHGIKRGLTAIEAAILMEQPLDKILTMILFAVIKKGAASVVTREPLRLKIIEPEPEGLQPYEVDFLKAFAQTKDKNRRDALQDMTIDLVRSVSKKMKGFSRKETIAYYSGIIERAWKQVEAADTPEVKSQKYDEVMEWTMLDRDYDDRTRRVFHGGPVFVPVWWPHYDPTFSRGAAARPVSAPSTPGGGGVALPHLPGSDFAASMVKGVQNFSSNVIGNLTDFTGKVTSKTNPAPVSTRSSSRSSGSFRSGGGCACACACACAGCACACAGGGR